MMAEILTSEDRVSNSFHPLPLLVSHNPSISNIYILCFSFLAEIEKGEVQSGPSQ